MAIGPRLGLWASPFFGGGHFSTASINKTTVTVNIFCEAIIYTATVDESDRHD